MPANDLSVLGRIAKDPVAGKLNHSHLQALGCIVAIPGSTPSSVGRKIGMTLGAASRVVERLVTEKLVTRTHDTIDKRAVLLQPTKAGRAVHARVAAILERGSA